MNYENKVKFQILIKLLHNFDLKFKNFLYIYVFLLYIE